MKKFLKALLIILFLLLLAAAAVAFWQWDNIQAVLLYRENSSQELAEMMSEVQEHKQKALAQYEGQLTTHDLTPEQEAEVISGQLSVTEAMAIVGVTAPDENSGIDTAVSDQAQITDYYLSQVYAMKVEFLGRLSGLYGDALTVWQELPAEERTAARKKTLGMNYMVQAYNLEAECDGRIDSLLTSMTADLTAAGADTAVTELIRQAYAEEKSVKKAYYLSLINE